MRFIATVIEPEVQLHLDADTDTAVEETLEDPREWFKESACAE